MAFLLEEDRSTRKADPAFYQVGHGPSIAIKPGTEREDRIYPPGHHVCW